MFGQFPALATNVVFVRWSKQPEDIWAFFDVTGGGFGVQVDPGLEYLIVWAPGGQAEYGDWDGDQVAPAIAHVRIIVAQLAV
jgi:hypothetical protein